MELIWRMEGIEGGVDEEGTLLTGVYGAKIYGRYTIDWSVWS